MVVFTRKRKRKELIETLMKDFSRVKEARAVVAVYLPETDWFESVRPLEDKFKGTHTLSLTELEELKEKVTALDGSLALELKTAIVERFAAFFSSAENALEAIERSVDDSEYLTPGTFVSLVSGVGRCQEEYIDLEWSLTGKAFAAVLAGMKFQEAADLLTDLYKSRTAKLQEVVDGFYENPELKRKVSSGKFKFETLTFMSSHLPQEERSFVMENSNWSEVILLWAPVVELKPKALWVFSLDAKNQVSFNSPFYVFPKALERIPEIASLLEDDKFEKLTITDASTPLIEMVTNFYLNQTYDSLEDSYDAAKELM